MHTNIPFIENTDKNGHSIVFEFVKNKLDVVCDNIIKYSLDKLNCRFRKIKFIKHLFDKSTYRNRNKTYRKNLAE